MRYSFVTLLSLSLAFSLAKSIEISVRAEERRDEGPNVKQDTDPRRNDLEPKRRRIPVKHVASWRTATV